MLSVIIPVYNVQVYLNECVSSVVNQSYEDLEIILVNDGSTDESGGLCDAWAMKDARIQVIHKKNGGLSSARNAGLQKATGKYVTFVDSDDVIDRHMYASLLEVFRKHADVDIACCNIEQFEDKDYSKRKFFLAINEGEFSVSEYLQKIFEHKIDNAVWNKIYSRDKIKDVYFEEGRINEDILFNVAVLSRTRKIFYIKDAFYKYRIRSGSITKQANPKLFDFIDNAFEIKNIVLDKMKLPLSVEIEGYIYYEMVNCIATIEKYNSAKAYNSQIKYCKSYIMWHPLMAFKNPHWSSKQKVKFFLVSYFPLIYRFLLSLK